MDVLKRQHKKKIVLFEPMYYGQRRMVQRAPLALLAISGLLDQENYEICVVSRKLFDDPAKKVLDECSNAICFGVTSLTGYQIIDGLEMSRLVKQQYPDLPIIWGGWHPTLDPNQTIASPHIDFIARGQGERTFYEFVKAVERGGKFDDIAGLSFKHEGKIVHNAERELEDINNFPPYPYHLIDVEKILSNDEFGNRVINYISSYGCPNNCSFCAEHLMHKRKWSGLSSGRMIADFENFQRKYGIDCVAINDTQFFMDKKRVVEFCNGLIDRKINLKWDNVEGNIRQLIQWDDKLWELLIRSGLSSILVGAESGFPEALALVNKPLKLEETHLFIEKARRFEMRVLYSMMIGLPWDKDYKKTDSLITQEITRTLELSEKIIQAGNKNRVLLCIYTPYPGNSLYQRSIDIGLVPPVDLEGWGRWNVMQKTTPWIDPEKAELTNFISSYLFFFLDSSSYGWVTARVKNPLVRFLFRLVFRCFILIARLRWKFKFFGVRLDYRIYLLGREWLKIA